MPAPDSGNLLLVAAGDAAAFARILGAWRGPVYALFERTREPSAAVEAAADVFERLYGTASRYAPGTPFPVWLFGLAARRLQDDPAGPAPSIPASRLTESQAARTAFLRSAVAALPPAERAAFLLTRTGRLTLPVAAQALGIPESDLKRKLVKAMETLRVSLGPLMDSASGGTPREHEPREQAPHDEAPHDEAPHQEEAHEEEPRVEPLAEAREADEEPS